MGIFNALTFLLFAGILSSTIAQRRNDRIPPYHRVLGYVNTTVAEIEEFDEELCTKNGGPTAYEDHKKSWRQLNHCIYSVNMEVSQSVMLAPDSSQRDIMEATYDGYCQRVAILENCMKNITDSMKTCLDPEKHEGVNVIYNTISSVIRFICEDTASHLKMLAVISEFSTAEGRECVVSTLPALQDCDNQTIIKYIHAIIPNGAPISGLGAVHLLVPDTDKCTVLEKFQLCTVQVLRNCTSSVSGELLNSILNVVKDVTSCSRLLKSQASPTPVVDVLLMTVILVMSLRLV